MIPPTLHIQLLGHILYALYPFLTLRTLLLTFSLPLMSLLNNVYVQREIRCSGQDACRGTGSLAPRTGTLPSPSHPFSTVVITLPEMLYTVPLILVSICPVMYFVE